MKRIFYNLCYFGLEIHIERSLQLHPDKTPGISSILLNTLKSLKPAAIML
jgi:hypothetical protein